MWDVNNPLWESSAKRLRACLYSRTTTVKSHKNTSVNIFTHKYVHVCKYKEPRKHRTQFEKHIIYFAVHDVKLK